MRERPLIKRPRSLILVPVPAEERRRQQPLRRDSWWEIGAAWLRYQSIQIRWDIERALARLLHRRWIQR